MISSNFSSFKWVSTLILIAFMLSSCTICIDGKGVKEEEERVLDNFSELEINIDANVLIRIGDEPSVTISTQENLLDAITSDVRGETMIIKSDPCIRSDYPIDIEITTNSLARIELNGSAVITALDELHSDDFNLKINGSGNVNVEVFTNDLRMKINGSGNIMINGAAQDVDIVINGSGDVFASELDSYKSNIRINGSGDASINAINYLNVSVSGSGDVKYSGNPTIETSISGSGSIRKVN